MDKLNHPTNLTEQGELSEDRNLFSHAQDVVLSLTEDGQILSFNEAFSRLTGCDLEEWVGNRLEAVIHPADVTRFREMLKQAGARRQPPPEEIRLRAKDGKELLLECIAFPVKKNGTTTIMMFGREFSLRKRKEEDLFESEAKLKSVLESANDAIVFIGSHLEILSWNRAAQQIFGHAENIGGRHFDSLLKENSREAYHATIDELQKGGESLLLGKTLELEGIRANGTEFPLELSLAVWIFRGNPIFAAIIRDITKRKTAEKALKKKTSLVQLIQEIAIASNEAVDPEEAIRYALERICTSTGWSIGHVYVPLNGKAASTSIWYLKDEERLKPIKEASESNAVKTDRILPSYVIQNKKSVWITDVTTNKDFQRRDAAIEAGLETAFAVPVFKGPEVSAVLEFFSDTRQEVDQDLMDAMEIVGTQLGRVFERSEALKLLRDAEGRYKQTAERMRALSAHLQFVREQERIKIAREVHDDLGQVLSALRMELSLLNQNLMESSAIAPRQQILQELGTMSNLVDDTIRSVRRIITELRPEVLDHLDLSSALEWQTQEFRARTGIKTTFESLVNNAALHQDGVTALFRILQETLTNVSRHAQASQLHVKLIENEESIILEVKDNGKGITEEETRKTGSFGILGMRERVLLLGGTLTMTGAPGEGTTVRVEVPLSENR